MICQKSVSHNAVETSSLMSLGELCGLSGQEKLFAVQEFFPLSRFALSTTFGGVRKNCTENGIWGTTYISGDGRSYSPKWETGLPGPLQRGWSITLHGSTEILMTCWDDQQTDITGSSVSLCHGRLLLRSSAQQSHLLSWGRKCWGNVNPIS